MYDTLRVCSAFRPDSAGIGVPAPVAFAATSCPLSPDFWATAAEATLIGSYVKCGEGLVVVKAPERVCWIPISVPAAWILHLIWSRQIESFARRLRSNSSGMQPKLCYCGGYVWIKKQSKTTTTTKTEAVVCSVRI